MRQRSIATPATGGAGAATPRRLALRRAARPSGLTEDNADLLWARGCRARAGGAAFQRSRERLTALHPRYMRLLVNWAALQPPPDRPPALAGAGRRLRARGRRRAAPTPALRGELAAIASQQRAARAGAAGYEVVLDSSASRPGRRSPPRRVRARRHACLRRGRSAAPALAGYRALIRSLLALAAREGVALAVVEPVERAQRPALPQPAARDLQRRRRAARCRRPVRPARRRRWRASCAPRRRSPSAARRAQRPRQRLAAPHERRQRSSRRCPPSVAVPQRAPGRYTPTRSRPRRRRATPTRSSRSSARWTRAADARARRTVWVTEAGAGAPHPGQAEAAPAQPTSATAAGRSPRSCAIGTERPARRGGVPVHLPRGPGVSGGPAQRRSVARLPDLSPVALIHARAARAASRRRRPRRSARRWSTRGATAPVDAQPGPGAPARRRAPARAGRRARADPAAHDALRRGRARAARRPPTARGGSWRSASTRAPRRWRCSARSARTPSFT